MSSYTHNTEDLKTVAEIRAYVLNCSSPSVHISRAVFALIEDELYERLTRISERRYHVGLTGLAEDIRRGDVHDVVDFLDVLNDGEKEGL